MMKLNNKINRKTTRALGKKGVALAVFLAMTIAMVPVSTMTANAATSSASYVKEAQTTFTFTDSSVSVTSGTDSGYKADGTDLTINQSGIYIITGSCSKGSVKVKKGTSGVTLILKNLTLSNSDGAPITINKDNTDTTIVISGTNTLTDNEDPDDEYLEDGTENDNFEGAGIKLKSSGTLLITGDGTLNVNGNCKNGIKGGDGSTITIGATSTDTFTLNVNAANDGISSDGAEGVTGLEIIGGNINVSASDDAIKSDYILNIGKQGTTGGANINVRSSTEGFEGATVNLYGGTANIVSSDDGINAANSDLTNYSYSLNIYGGTWNINAGGDGLDSNGTLKVSGGVTDISSSTQNDNNAIDWGENSTSTVTGGTIIGIGMGGMQQGFTSGNYVMFSASLSKGNTVSIKDSSGNTLYTTTVKKSANSVIFSDDALVDGATYTLYVNGSSVATATEGTSQGGFGPGGQGGMTPPNGGQAGGNGGMGPGGNGGMTPPDGGQPGGNDGMTPPDGSTPPDGMTPPDGSGSTDSDTSGGTGGDTSSTGDDTSGNTGDNTDSGSTSTDDGLYSNVLSVNENEGTADVYDDVAGTKATVSLDIISEGTVYRMYDPNRGEHFYTKNPGDVFYLMSEGWVYEENDNFTVVSASEKDAVPVYRLYNPNGTGMHFYTASAGDAIQLKMNGWNYEGIAYYAYKESSNKGTAQYKFYNPNSSEGEHVWTTKESDCEFLRNIGWIDEGIAWRIK